MSPTHKDLPELQSPGPFDSQSFLNRVLSRKRFLKFAAVLVAFFVAAFIVTSLTGIFNPVLEAQRYLLERKILNEAREREEFEKNDTYGGKTPEETYQLFLQALEEQDIELASKYFVREKQAEIKQRLARIRDDGKWQLMYGDLSGGKTDVEYKKVHESWYEVEILNKSGGLVAAFRIEKYHQKPLWKLTQFF